MIFIPRWKIILIIASCVLAFLYAAPNLLPKETRERLEASSPSFFPHSAVSLGLDLQGGAYLLLQVDLSSVIKERLEDLLVSTRQQLRQEKISYDGLKRQDDGIEISLQNPSDAEKVRSILRGLDSSLSEAMRGDKIVVARFEEVGLRQLKDQTLSQSIEIVRRRVDESGTKESSIARQGDDRIIIQIPGLTSPDRIKELLGKTAKLSFHLVDPTGGAGSRLLPLTEEPGQKIAIERRAILTGDMLTSAQPSTDIGGGPVVSFALNGNGAKRFCDVTRDNTNKPFAIVLDNEVISAPRINEPICGGQAQISGNFTIQETYDLSVLLRAGALPAPLKIIEERTIGPSLGSDSVASGKIAGIVGLLAVMTWMVACYGLFGSFAAAALFINVVMIFALLSVLGATLTLPGIAGIVLTIGMAVDANVLIFERIREEIRNGRSVISSIDAGYTRAIATVIDSNLTTLIAALVLFSFGSGPIKGFAITLSIGILTSIYSAVMITRLMVVSWYKAVKPAELKV